jgi:hypothetical protein
MTGHKMCYFCAFLIKENVSNSSLSIGIGVKELCRTSQSCIPATQNLFIYTLNVVPNLR